jgi:hypothetical protein
VRAGKYLVFRKEGANVTAVVTPDRHGTYAIEFARLGERSP